MFICEDCGEELLSSYGYDVASEMDAEPGRCEECSKECAIGHDILLSETHLWRTW